jgi:glycosyltransferase involved in cell wall biosynthesis
VNKKVSIIIPVYNAEKYIDRCIESIIKQTYKNFEIILIDDGSTDNSLKIIENWYKKYPKKIKIIKQKNMGTGDARNKGLDIVTGEFLTFVDSDDYLDIDFLYSHMSAIGDNDLTISGYKNVKNDKVVFNRRICNNQYAKYKQMEIWSKMYRIDFIKKNDIYFQNIRTGQDIVFSFDIYKNNPKIKIIKYTGYNNIFNVNSITHNKKIQSDSDIVYLLNCIDKSIYNTNFYNNNKYNLYYFYIKEFLARLAKKSEYLDEIELSIVENEFYNWIISICKKYGVKFKFCNRVHEKIYINVAINTYILFRKFGLNKFFIKILVRVIKEN